MKMYLLTMLISVIVGFSYFPDRRRAANPTLDSPKSLPAEA